MKLFPLVFPFLLAACGSSSDSDEFPEAKTGTCMAYGPQVDESECAAGRHYFGCVGGVAPEASGCKAVSAEEVNGRVVVGFCCEAS